PEADDARLPDEGLRRRAAEVPDLQRLARRERREPHAQEVFPHRLRRRHAQWFGCSGRARCRQEGRVPDRQGNRRPRREGAGRQALARGHERWLLLDQFARRHRRHEVHADRQRAGSRDPRRVEIGDAPGVGWQAVRTAPDPAALAELRPPRGRWRRRRALRRVPRATARRHASRDALTGVARMARTEVKVPDIGGYDDVPVIELLVAVGDTVKLDQGLVTLESDKATMEVPSSVAGKIVELKVKVGDKLSEGSVVAVVEAEGAAEAKAADAAPKAAATAPAAPAAPAKAPAPAASHAPPVTASPSAPATAPGPAAAAATGRK